MNILDHKSPRVIKIVPTLLLITRNKKTHYPQDQATAQTATGHH